jgi:multidrug efflux pump subunit AcrB
MADVFVQMPRASAKEIEQRVTFPLEKLIKELPGVEYVYSTSRPGSSLAIVRFLVGQKNEDAIVQLYNKLYANFDKIPPGASQPLIKSRSIDDVPILSLTLWSDRSNAAELRQIAAQLDEQIKQVPNVSETTLIGGQKRQLRVDLDPIRLNSFGLSPLEISQAFQTQNAQLASGAINQGNKSFLVRTQSFMRSSEDAQNLVVATVNNQPVYLRDVATITDGAEEPASYVFYGHGVAAMREPENSLKGETDAVTISVAKRPGANAIAVTHEVLNKLDQIKRNYLPQHVHLSVTRNYGETAAERSNELLVHMAISVASVTVLMWFALGKKAAWVIAVSIPVTLALTLTSFVGYGFSLNRVTFFALIFSIGILVDDAIVVVENVGRHLHMPENKERLQVSSNRRRTLQQIVLEAVDEVGNPTILATFAVIAAILPMAFVGGLMGPYMHPIPLGASAAMIFSALVAVYRRPLDCGAGIYEWIWWAPAGRGCAQSALPPLYAPPHPRSGANLADIQVNFAPKGDRRRQSHEIAKAIRPHLKQIADRYQARIQVAEIPPGPPVLQTLVTEVYGPDYPQQIELASKIKEIYQTTPGVADVDWYIESPQTDYSIYHKNLQPVVYITGDVSGRVESAVYAMLALQPQIDKINPKQPIETYLTAQPTSTETAAIKWDGEWHVTYEVFRDLGIAFAVVLILIFAIIIAIGCANSLL